MFRFLTRILVMVSISLPLLVACSQEPESQKVRKEVDEAANAVGEWTQAKKEAFVRKYGDELEALKKGAAKARAAAQATGEELTQETVKAWDELDDHFAQADEKLAQFGSTAADQLDAAAEQLNQMMNDIRERYKELTAEESEGNTGGAG
jgi:hypothetical protein